MTDQHRPPRRPFLPALLIVLVAFALGGCSATDPSPSSPRASSWRPAETVQTPLGAVRGTAEGDVLRYQGIRYAQAPTGDARFTPPRPVEPWTAELDATRPGSACIQAEPTGGVKGSEDCLTLNVTVPNRAAAAPRPVMVWLHGGGFTQGEGSTYDPRRLATEGDVIVVTVNYRLGALGLLAIPGLEGGGTFALADQQEALRFIQATAASFGGDPGNVTLFGESAGGTSVCHHLVSPPAGPLLQRAIIQSAVDCGAPSPPHAYGLPREGEPDTLTPRTRGEVEPLHMAAAEAMGCSGAPEEVLACLRGLPPESFLATQGVFTLPAIDGELVPDVPARLLADVRKPVLTGFTRDEARIHPMLATLTGQRYPAGSYEPAIRRSFGARADEVLQRYPRDAYPDDATAWAAVYTDATFACPQLHANDLLSEGTTVYAYEFADQTTPPPVPQLLGMPAAGAAHSTELPYLFDMSSQPIDKTGAKVPLTPQQQGLADEMVGIWTGFAATGDVPSRPWAEGHRAMTFSETGVSTSDPAEVHQCGFWKVGG